MAGSIANEASVDVGSAGDAKYEAPSYTVAAILQLLSNSLSLLMVGAVVADVEVAYLGCLLYAAVWSLACSLFSICG